MVKNIIMIFILVISSGALADNYHHHDYGYQDKGSGSSLALAGNAQHCEFDTYKGQWFGGTGGIDGATAMAFGLCLRPKDSRLLFSGSFGVEENKNFGYSFGVNGRF